MLIYCKHLKHQIYDDIRSSIKDVYRIDTTDSEDVIMNAIPIKYKEDYWIVSNITNLEISSLDLTKDIYEIKYVLSKEINGSIFIKKVYSLHEIFLNNCMEDIDCLYDEHLNIMFIKFKDIRIKYIDINDQKIENFFKIKNNNIIFSWINNLLETKTILSSDNQIIVEDKFLNLPSIPYIVSDPNMIDELVNSPILNYPCTGAAVFNDVGDFIGIVSYVNKKQIVSISVNLIKRSLRYMDQKVLYKFNYKLVPIKISLKNALGTDIIENALYYSKIEKKECKEIHNVILSIDEYPISETGELLINNNLVPLSTYLWLFKNDDIVKIKAITRNILKNIRINNKIEELTIDCRDIDNFRFSYYNMKLSSNAKCALYVSKLNFIKYNKKILIEINEKLMQILKILIIETNNFDELYDYVNENLFSNKKIVVLIDNNINIKIIKKIKNTVVNNLDSIIKYYKNQTTLKKYINSI